MFRIIVGKLRFFYYCRIKGNLRTIESDKAVPNTISHNLKSLAKFGFTRMNKIIKPISVIETLNEDSKFLIIGPRNEEDLLNLCGNGFKLKNIKGLDLISYSPLIEVGDMHNMNFQDNQFDATICGWTIAYSNDPKKAIDEMIRVTKPNGLIAISLEYSDLNNEQQEQKLGYKLNDTSLRLNNTSLIKNLCADNINHIYFDHDAPSKVSHTVEKTMKNVSAIVLIFSIKK